MIIEELRRYPVKSMLGERLTRADVGSAGIAGDRRLALLDRATGLVVSAKNPRRWRAVLALRAAGGPEDPVRITLPDGREIRSLAGLDGLDRPDERGGRPGAGPDGPARRDEVDALLSEVLGAAVTLTATAPAGAALERSRPDEVLAAGFTTVVTVDAVPLPAGTGGGSFVDFAPLHLVTTATLDRIGAEVPGRAVHVDRYRPNLVVRTPGGAGFEENGWVGRTLRIGPEVTLRVLVPTPRCAVPTLAHGALPPEPDALRVPARLNRVVPVPELGPLPCVGAYAQVVRPGRVSVGDAVEVD